MINSFTFDIVNRKSLIYCCQLCSNYIYLPCSTAILKALVKPDMTRIPRTMDTLISPRTSLRPLTTETSSK